MQRAWCRWSSPLAPAGVLAKSMAWVEAQRLGDREFVLPPLDPGTAIGLAVVAGKNSLPHLETGMHVGETNPLVVDIPRRRKLIGRILDPEGRPLADAAVRWHRGGERAADGTRSNAEGRFSFLLPGPPTPKTDQVVVVVHPGDLGIEEADLLGGSRRLTVRADSNVLTIG